MSSMAGAGSRARKRTILLLPAVLAACGGRATDDPTFAARSYPCVQQGYPCTWNEVDPEVVTRTKLLGGIAARYSLTTPSLDSIAAFLADQPAITEVVVDGSGVRFRLEAGRPAWVFLPTELDHHRPPEELPGRIGHGGSRPNASERGTQPSQPRFAVSSLASGLAGWLGPQPLSASGPPPQGERIVGEPGEGKKALILSPFDFEWPDVGFKSLGADFARRTRVIKDYQEAHGGEVTYRADLSKLSDNPAAPDREQLTLGGELMLSGEVTFDDFLGWDTRQLNLILLASHGSATSCFRPVPSGGQAATRYTANALTGMLLCPLIYLGRAKQEDYGNHHGVEIYMAANYSWPQPPDPTTRFDSPGETGWRDVRPELSGSEARECAAAVASGAASPTTAAGLPCGSPKWEHDYPMLVLWWPFFLEQYPNGLEKVIVFLGACNSGINMVLPNILAPDGNDAVSVFGFDSTVSAVDAWEVIGSMLDLVDDGYHSKELIRRLKLLDRTKHLVGRAMDPGHQALPATPAEILDKGTHPTHGRDVVQLVDPASGEEIQDSATVLVLGAAGDGKPDSLYLRPRIIGVAPSDPVDQVRLAVLVKGSGSGGRRYVPNDRVRAGVHQYDGDVELSRDFTEGEVVDLEIRADLPGGGESRWVYRGIRLRSSYWRATVGLGRFPGTFSGWRGKANLMGTKLIVTLESDPDQRPSVLVTINTGDNPLGAPGPVEMCKVEMAFSPSGNFMADLQANRAANVCSGGPADGYPATALVEVRRVRDGWVEGWASGTFFRGHPYPPDPSEQGLVRIDFRVPLCTGFPGSC